MSFLKEEILELEQENYKDYKAYKKEKSIQRIMGNKDYPPYTQNKQ